MNKLKKSFVGLGLLLTSSVSLSAVSCFNNFDFFSRWTGRSNSNSANVDKSIQKAIYDGNECIQIGYFKNQNGEIQISQFKEDVSRVPKELPKEITSLENAFVGATRIQIPGIESWDTSNIKNMKHVFLNAKGFNYDISDWDTSNVTTMHGMFKGASNFNKPLITKLTNRNNKSYRAWNVANVADMSHMFHGATNFNSSLFDDTKKCNKYDCYV
ncbi:BspA family leucine-rich repeat surface protein [Mycoplasmopsis agalactiae]|uniref:BspA family leucine-rich repeat surface protein n=1 Tax=Mycoplasmopsis agalactiae TaxID=2110 RepID=UPI002F3F53D5